jgi:hypothetical protein
MRFCRPGLIERQEQRVELALSGVRFGVVRRRMHVFAALRTWS